MKDKHQLINALEKKALGNQIDIISEEYTQNEKGDFVLTKKTKKTTINDIDTSALLKLIEIREKEQENEFARLSDDELRELGIKYALELLENEQKRRKKK